MTAAPALAVSFDHWPYPRWVAHRGAGKQAPENTLAAFRLGASHGWRMFECDVKFSADEQLFLLHDATLDRTTRAPGIAGEIGWNLLAALDAGGWHSPAYAGEPLPRLESIVHFVLATGSALNIEIKPTPGSEARTGELVARFLQQRWPRDVAPPLLTSFKPESLAAAREVDPSLPRGLLVDTLWTADESGTGLDWLATARSLDCVAVVTNHKVMTAEVCRTLHQSRLRALCYTVNDEAEAARLLALGVDGLITDEVHRFKPD
ncbi:MAG: Glycerophosphodiester phosphodiesterase, cytoplasmic [Paracidovorax wautersii]|uniref:Glycerophosphodiester phosphodiesterase, cytoplasmic n=1 Tax=Paracidovorax wautersii TaxID=1177982 RepID=A0A7V8FRB0_9BURK|nr:MAG: Glycerophosphodiester phosphodiesterase, cytoplasmic [Paracidovorax wautersii]